MLSMKAKYALRALTVMAKNEKKMLQSKAIAYEADVPQKFLENILQELKHNGLVESKRGIFGGYFLAVPSSKITVGSVIRVIDGPLAPIRCASLTAYQKCDDCVDEKTCQIRKTMVEVRNAIANVLDNKSILEYVGEGELGI
jgi:Rrf2 family protein